jgi:DNA polymerase III subunit epsilon
LKLKLLKPLAFFDLETTGINMATDRIVEIAIAKIMPDGEIIRKRKLINPEMPIPKQASDIHGILDEMVKDAPTFKQAANEIKQFIEGCDLGGYNSNRFDIPLLAEEFLRIGMEVDLVTRQFVDVQHIFHMMEKRTLGAAYQFYCGKTLENAHSAMVDVDATWEVLQSQLERYPQLGDSLESILKVAATEKIVDFARRFVFQDGKEVFNFGKYKGRPVEDVLRAEPQYYDWMMRGDFAMNTKMKLTEIFNRIALTKR